MLLVEPEQDAYLRLPLVSSESGCGLDLCNLLVECGDRFLEHPPMGWRYRAAQVVARASPGEFQGLFAFCRKARLRR